MSLYRPKDKGHNHEYSLWHLRGRSHREQVVTLRFRLPLSTSPYFCWSIYLLIPCDRVGRSSKWKHILLNKRQLNKFDTIEYWNELASGDDFAGRTLATCVEVIHADIVGAWNFPDKDRVRLSVCLACLAC